MKGFDYTIDKAVDRPLSAWKKEAAAQVKRGGFIREDRELGETFIHAKVQHGPSIVAEVYGINLNLTGNS